MTKVAESTFKVLPVDESGVTRSLRLVTKALYETHRMGAEEDFVGRWKYLDTRIRQIAAGGPFDASILLVRGSPRGISLICFDETEPEEVGCWELFWARGAPGSAVRALGMQSLARAREKGLRGVTAYVHSVNRTARRAARLVRMRPVEVEYRLSDVEDFLSRSRRRGNG